MQEQVVSVWNTCKYTATFTIPTRFQRKEYPFQRSKESYIPKAYLTFFDTEDFTFWKASSKCLREILISP